MHQSTGRLPVPGCTYTNRAHQAKHTNDPRSLQIKATFSCEVMHASMLRKLGGNRTVWSYILPGLPTHLVQELNVDTVVCNLTKYIPWFVVLKYYTKFKNHNSNNCSHCHNIAKRFMLCPLNTLCFTGRFLRF